MKTLIIVCSFLPLFSLGQNLTPCQALDDYSSYWGYCENDQVVIEQNYGWAYPFIKGLAVVQNWLGKYDIIDEKGKLVSDIAYDDFYRIDDGGFVLKKDLKWGFYDSKLKPILTEFSVEYAVIEKFNNKHVYSYNDRILNSETVICVKKGNLFGAINLKGEERVPFKYNFLRNFGALSISVNEFITARKGKIYIVNEEGSRLRKYSSDGFVGEKEGLLYYFQEGRLFSLNSEGKEIDLEGEETFGRIVYDLEDRLNVLGNDSNRVVFSNCNEVDREALKEEFLNSQAEYFNCISNDKLGLTNGHLTQVLNCKYDRIEFEEIDKMKVYILSRDDQLTLGTESNGQVVEFESSKYRYTSKYYIYDNYYKEFAGLVDSIGHVLILKEGKLFETPRFEETIVTKRKNSLYGLVKGGKPLCAFDFNGFTLEDYKKEVFIASTDTGEICMSFDGKILYPYAFNMLWACDANDGYYVAEKGELYGIFSEDGTVNMPMVKIRNPWAEFNIDNAVYNTIKWEYVVEKDGKLGIMNTKGKFSLKPNYDHISIEEMFDVYGDIFKYIFVKQDNKWFILDDFGNEFKTLDIDTWHGKQSVRTAKSSYATEFYMGTKNGKPLYYDFGFNLMDKFNLDVEMAVVGKYGSQGIIDGSGKLVLPLKYRSIDKYYFDEVEVYYLNTTDKKMGLMTNKGKVILGPIYDKVSIICGETSYYLIYKDGLGAFASFDPLTSKFNVMSDFLYTNSNCHSLDKSKPLCKVSLNGKRVYLYQDGHTEEMEKKD